MASKKPEEFVGRNKKMGIKRFFNSIKFSIEGLIYAYGHEQSMLTHAIATILIVILGICLGITFNQWAILIIALVVILSVELLNTAVEATVDLVTDKYHPLAKIAKDCGSAAAFVASLALTAICLFIFVPYVIALFK